MASLEEDFRFVKASSSKQGYGQDAVDDEEEPLFGSSDTANGDSYSEYIRKSFRAEEDASEASSSSLPNSRKPREPPALDAHINTELYAVLNLEKDASTEDILRTYRSLAVSFHPDKHRDPELKLAAQRSFERVQYAYEILSDPHRRAVYDLLGEEGLKSNWQVGPKLKTQEELRAEFEKHRLKRAQANIENLIRSRTEATVSLDASPYIDASQGFLQALESIAYSDIRQLFMKASTMSVLTPSTQLTYTGSMLARRGAGGGNFTVAAKHQYSPKLAFDASTTLLHPRVLNVKAAYALSSETFVNVDTTVRSPYRPPPFNITCGTRVNKSFTSFIKFSSGTSYSFLMPLFETAPFPGSPSTATVGVAGNAYSIDISTNQFLQTQLSGSYGNLPVLGQGKNSWKLNVSGGVASTGGATIGVGAERRLTENTHVSLGINFGLGNGALTLRIRISRLGQKLNLPILLSQAPSPQLILGSIVVPGIGIASIQYFYLTPRKRRRIAEKLRELREEMKEQNEEKRKEALDAAALLAEQTGRKREAERSRDGLIIVSAYYRGGGPGVEEEEVKASQLDVTVPLQALVVSSTSPQGPAASKTVTSSLTIPGGRSKANLIGFYDVLVGSKKELVVEYLFKGRRHQAAFDDYQAVAIPMRSHLVD